MTRAYLTLFLFGLTAGAVSVAVRFFRGTISGEYPDRLLPFPRAKKRKEDRSGASGSFLFYWTSSSLF